MTQLNLVITSLFVFSCLLFYFIVPKSNRWHVLLAISFAFYFLLVGYKVALIVALAGMTYGFGHLIYYKKLNLVIPITLLLFPLLIFKITNESGHFNTHQSNLLFSFEWQETTSLLKVIGLSYITFNSISYLIDIKRQYIKPEKNLFLLTLYLIYFPTVFSGPLHRATYMFNQFRNIDISNASISKGLRLILWGLFKNMVIAQRLFIVLTQLQNSTLGGYYYLFVGLLFFLYLYCNFSSFIDFFQGISALFNITLKDNFRNRVYFSSSRQEFWKGWHITLNEWFRDYFFFVITKNDKKRRFTDYFLLITFLLIALWHEFSIMMLLWGTCNGLWIVIEKKIILKNQTSSTLKTSVGILYHLAVASLLALIFISPSPTFIMNKIIYLPSQLPFHFFQDYSLRLIIIIVCLIIMDYHYFKAKDTRFDLYLETKPTWYRWLVYFKLTTIILVFGMSAGIQNYYIQF